MESIAPNVTASDNSLKPEFALEKIGGKWKMPILWRLRQKKVWRYNELKRDLGQISDKMLSRQLRELETDGLIARHMYPVVPPKVEYRLTELGQTTLPAITALCELQNSLSHKSVEPTQY
jgi:DNA-binding HxlR family transcriptional regulator